MKKFRFIALMLFSLLCIFSCKPKDPVIAVSGITLNSTSITLVEGESYTLEATVSPSNASNKLVLWTASNSSVASVKDGVVTAFKPGLSIITAVSDDGGLKASCLVTVETSTVSVQSVSLDKDVISLIEGDSAILTATVLPENASNKNVSWVSNNMLVATVDADGKVTAVKAGTATVTVTTQDGGRTATCAVTVNEKVYPVESVSLNKTSLTLTEGDSETLTATITPSNASNKSVTWKSSDAIVASVDSEGNVTAHKAGSATITVTTEDGGKTATCAVTVNEKVYPVESVSLNKTSLTLTEGDSETLTATITPSNASNKNVTWSSDNTSVATVDADGKVTAVKAGTATVTVTTQDGGRTATCSVTVNEKTIPVTGVDLSCSSAKILIGKTLTLVATVNPSDASNKSVDWKSSNSSVASVVNGVVTAVAVGKATITVTTMDGGYTASCSVEVYDDGDVNGNGENFEWGN